MNAFAKFPAQKAALRMCCKCRKFPAVRQHRSSYCLACRAAYMRSWRTTHPYSEMSAAARFKSVMRSIANVYLRRGKLQRAPCSLCGSHKAEKHHPDYSAPLLVVWLCRDCHLQHHRENTETDERYVERLAEQWDKKRIERVKRLRRVAKNQNTGRLIAAKQRGYLTKASAP